MRLVDRILPVPQDAATSELVVRVCVIAGVAGYAGGSGGLLSGTLPYAADVYGASDAELGVGLAVVRLGVLLALGLALVADRRGRAGFVRRAAVAHVLLAAALGLAPTFALYIAGHALLRCVDTALLIALTVLALERVPAGNRASTVALTFFATGTGVAVGVFALPLAAEGRSGLAAVYLAGLVVLPVVLWAARGLGESPRFAAHIGEPHDLRELARGRERSRLLLVGGVTLLLAAFFAPLTEFFTRYLDDEHGFSATELVVFLSVTGPPAVLGLLLGGRLADARGRKPVGIPFTLLSALAFAAFFLVDGAALWALALLGQLVGAAGGVALQVYGPELFPTRVRAAANGALAVITVAGSALGLLGVALLSDPLGLGGALAALVVFPVAGLAIAALRYPETAGIELERTSGEVTPPSPSASPRRGP